MRCLGMLARILCVLLRLAGMLLALRMVILAVSIGSGAVGLRCVFVMLRRFVVCVFHSKFSDWPANCGFRKCALNSGRNAQQ
jgi:hypothetical protein